RSRFSVRRSWFYMPPNREPRTWNPEPQANPEPRTLNPEPCFALRQFVAKQYMRPAPPRGAVLEQFWLRCAEFQLALVPDVSRLAPKPSEWPTCACSAVESEVQSAQVSPGSNVPSGADPVRMSCSTGDGDPIHWPLIRFPFSSTKRSAFPFIA